MPDNDPPRPMLPLLAGLARSLAGEAAAQAARESLRRELWSSIEDLIPKFLEIAERKVSEVDDYGDERWDALPEEIDRCIAKIARRHGWRADQIPTALPEEYHWLRRRLRQEFEQYHEHLRARPAVSFDFDNMSGMEFETWIRRLFENNGFEVQGTPRTGDQGADLIAKKNGITHVIQAKRHRKAVGNGAVQEVLSAVAYYRANAGCVITNATFTRSAKALAQSSGVELIDGTTLREILRR